MIDGSVFASNPALCALSTVGNLRFSNLQKSACRLNYPTLADTFLLSVGTGQFPPSPSEKKQSIMRTLMKTMMTTNGELVNHQLQQLFACHEEGEYCRLNPTLMNHAHALDAASPEQVLGLYEAGERFLQHSAYQIETLVKKLR